MSGSLVVVIVGQPELDQVPLHLDVRLHQLLWYLSDLGQLLLHFGLWVTGSGDEVLPDLVTDDLLGV